MKLYTVSWQNRPLVCLESQPGWLTPLPYETMNHLLMDTPDHRDQVLARAAKGRGEFSLGDVTVLAPIPHPRQDVICLGMNYRAHKAEAGLLLQAGHRLPRPGGAHPRPLRPGGQPGL